MWKYFDMPLFLDSLYQEKFSEWLGVVSFIIYLDLNDTYINISGTYLCTYCMKWNKNILFLNGLTNVGKTF